MVGDVTASAGVSVYSIVGVIDMGILRAESVGTFLELLTGLRQKEKCPNGLVSKGIY
jgi:hypothetical protein